MSATPQYRFQFCPHDATELVMDSQRHLGLPYCESCGFVDYQNPRPCVAVIVLNQTGALLLARRRFEPAKGELDFPGGFIDQGETAEEAVVREILEETSLEVRVTEFVGSVPDVYGSQGVPTLNLCFVAHIIGGKMAAKSDVAELVWVPMENLPQRMAFPHQQQVLLWCRERFGSAPSEIRV